MGKWANGEMGKWGNGEMEFVTPRRKLRQVRPQNIVMRRNEAESQVSPDGFPEIHAHWRSFAVPPSE
jgi:hypothetical protein